MPKTGVEQWDTTASNNGDIGGVDIAENCAAAGINNALRELMAQIATALSGSDTSIVTGTPGSDGQIGQWNADGDLVGVASTSPIGDHTIFIPWSAFEATSTDGAEDSTDELAGNGLMASGYDFDPTTSEKIQFTMAMPKSWDEGTLTAQIAWKDATTAGTGDVVWGVRMLAVGDGDAMDAAFGTAQTVTDTFQASDGLQITSATSAITPSGPPAEGDFLSIEIYRDAAAAGDTYTQDARLRGVKIIMTTDAATDD